MTTEGSPCGIPTPTRPDIHQAEDAQEIAVIRELFLEYASDLGIDLCFQGFEQELAGLPGDYAPPAGALLLATVDGQPAGCIGLRRHAGDIGELKRLYVRPAFRKSSLGWLLAVAAIERARAAGYIALTLDTLPSMSAALALYRSLGFRETAPYYRNPIPGAIFLRLDLSVGNTPAAQP